MNRRGWGGWDSAVASRPDVVMVAGPTNLPLVVSTGEQNPQNGMGVAPRRGTLRIEYRVCGSGGTQATLYRMLCCAAQNSCMGPRYFPPKCWLLMTPIRVSPEELSSSASSPRLQLLLKGSPHPVTGWCGIWPGTFILIQDNFLGMFSF